MPERERRAHPDKMLLLKTPSGLPILSTVQKTHAAVRTHMQLAMLLGERCTGITLILRLGVQHIGR